MAFCYQQKVVYRPDFKTFAYWADHIHTTAGQKVSPWMPGGNNVIKALSSINAGNSTVRSGSPRSASINVPGVGDSVAKSAPTQKGGTGVLR